MNKFDQAAIKQLLTATAAIEAVGYAVGEAHTSALQNALEQVLVLLGQPEGGIFLYNASGQSLKLAAWAPQNSALVHTSMQLALDRDAGYLPVQAVQHRTPQASTHEPGFEGRQATAVALSSDARLLGSLQVIAAAGQRLPDEHSWLLETLAARIAAALQHSWSEPGIPRAEERTRALVDASNDAILMLDPHGAATMINRRAKYFFGIAERDVIGRSPAQLQALFHRIFEDSQAFEDWLTPLLASPSARAVRELRVVRTEPRLLQCFSAPVLDHREQLLGRMLVFRDITREREVDQMKTDFVSIVSHELRTPLTSIRGALQLVLGRPQQPPLAERTRDLLAISLKNSERLIRLINDILDVSKIEQGSLQLHRAIIDPADLCRNALQEVETIAAERNITLQMLVPESFPPVSADRDRALQVLTNLISNAIKFSEPGQPVEVSATRSSRAIYFAVRDYGRGIAAEDHQRIFDKFHQLDSSLTRQASGTGLGLAICKALVEEQGGRIWVDSALGKGATFTFTLPLAGQAEPPATAPEQASQPTIIVADSSPGTRQKLSAMLEQAGYQVAEADSGAATLKLARSLQPALIALDSALPDLDSFDAAQLLWHDPQTRDIPVLFIASSSDHMRTLPPGTISARLLTIDELLNHVQRLTSTIQRRVLVMEDDYHVRPTLAHLLRRSGFAVSEAGDSRNGLSLLEREPPDLILLDVRMAAGEGFEVLRWLKHDQRFSNIPVVVLSVHDVEDDTEAHALALGAARYLEKPIASEELLAEIERLFIH